MFRNSEIIDQLQDKTDNVEVVYDNEGQPVDDYRDIGNRKMYKVPEYIEPSDKLPYEPSFGWVGRTDFEIVNERGAEDYDYTDYESPRVFRSNSDQDIFGGGFSRSGVDEDEGFGKDDLFFNFGPGLQNEIRDFGRERTYNDYSGMIIFFEFGYYLTTKIF